MVCRSEFVATVVRQANEPTCPNCKTNISPMHIVNDGYIKLNWEEIRLVAIYAQRWANGFDTSNTFNLEYTRALRNVITQIQQYMPRGANTLDSTEELPKDKAGNLTKPIKSPYYK